MFQIILFVTTLFWKKYSSSKNSESKMYENRTEKLLVLSFFSSMVKFLWLLTGWVLGKLLSEKFKISHFLI